MVMIQGESLGQRAGTLPPPPDEISLLDDDDMLLARMRAGDELAFRTLVDRHRPWLVRLCTRLLGYDAHAAEDAAQESLLKLLAAVQRDGRSLRVRPWLTVVARNTCIDQQRRRRPDLPGELPERAAPGDDPFALDAALADAWPRLSGRHREVLYLREVLGFSYKEIGEVMGLSGAAVETLVFRARGALRREYERAGGSAVGCGLFGFHLLRTGLRPQRQSALSDSVSNAAATDPGFGGLSERLVHFLSTSLPGCGEQAMAKILSVAAGVVVATAAVIPGIGLFSDAPASAAGGTPPAAAVVQTAAAVGPTGNDATGSPNGAKPASLKSMLGSAAPADWSPKASRTSSTPSAASTSTTTPARPLQALQESAQSRDRNLERPKLQRPARDGEEGPIRSILPDRPQRDPGSPEATVHPLRALLASVPTLLDPLPLESPSPEPPASEPVPVEPAPGDPESGSHPVREAAESMQESVAPQRDSLTPGDDSGNVADREPTLLQR